MRVILLALGLGAGLGLGIPAVSAQEAGPAAGLAQSDGRLVVSGEGRVALAPDMATVTMGVTEEAASAAEALGRVSLATDAVIERLRAFEVAARDMQTSGLSLHPVYRERRPDEEEPPAIIGFRAAMTLQVRVRDLDALGGILDEVAGAGANTFQGLTFGLNDDSAALDQARRAAVEDASARAALYAEAAGVPLGRLVELRESGTSMPPQPMMRASFDMAESGLKIAEGEIDITARVEMVFGLGAD